MRIMMAIRSSRGVTLVELMIVTLMMGIVTMAIFSLYQSTQRTASTQDEVVELQQNLRVGMDQIARDIRNAGFMIAGDPISVASANALTLQTGSTNGKMARITVAFNSPANDATATRDVTVASADMVDFFVSGASGDWVRIIRPPNQAQPLDDTFQVSSKDRDVPKLVLKDFVTATAVSYQPGDIIVRVSSSSGSALRTIAYSLSGTDLQRNDGVSTEVVASGINSLAFGYLLDDGTESSAPATLADIQAVRVTLTGQASTVEGTKNRSLTSVIKLRNR